MIEERQLSRWVERLRAEDTRIVAVLMHGSYARGEARPHSDLDLDLLFDGEPEVFYRSAFEEQPDGRLLHLTIASYRLESWLEQFDPPSESEAWAFYLPARQVARLLWATPAARERLEGRITLDLQASPQLQDLLESAGKVRNAYADGDDLGVRLAAQDLALRCPAVLGMLEPPPPAGTRREALQRALDLAGAPPGYREHLLLCLGLSGQASTMADLHTAALQLATGILDRLRPHSARLAGLVEPGLPEALADGRLHHLLTGNEG